MVRDDRMSSRSLRVHREQPEKRACGVQLIGLKLPLLSPGSDICEELLTASRHSGGLRDGDVLVISSKAISTVSGRLVELARVNPSARARRISKASGIRPEFVEVVFREADEVLGTTRGAILTLKLGMLCANAGVDSSNCPPGRVALLPKDPDREAERLRRKLRKRAGVRVGVVISDSGVSPLRTGTVGRAVGVAGVPPALDCRGQRDLYGRPLRQTFRAIADQLATAAQVLMGEGAEGVPAVIVRGLRFPKGKAWSSAKLGPEEDLYSCLLEGKVL